MHSLEFLISAPNVPRLGDPRRAPAYCYGEWGVKKGIYRRKSDALYRAEWEGGSQRQMDMVVEASKLAGLGDYPQMLRDYFAQAVSTIERQRKTRSNLLEIGAGISTVNAYEQLIRDGVDLEKVFGVYIEPSKKRLDNLVAKLSLMGLKRGKNYIARKDVDVNLLRYVEENSIDIAGAVATLHHHSYIDTPLKSLYRALAPGGLLIIADWHNHAWTHPSYIYNALLKNYQWETKEADMNRFVHVYPSALEKPPLVTNPFEQEANRIILDVFWPQFGKLRAGLIESGEFNAWDDLLQIEGPRPVEMQNMELKRTGYVLESDEIAMIKEALGVRNPHQLNNQNTLLMGTLAQRYE
ncbi:class I SAM-dependent methyltransferase [Candidatus Woesearchaeota archaeon]|nr:class I SAM-dependent methyltransferase [Candidatus Woesearchaeota archaeon]